MDRRQIDTRLKPRAILSRLRPLKTETIYSHLRGYQLLIRACNLTDSARLLSAQDDDWKQDVLDLCRLAQRLDWFDVDWATMNDVWRLAMETGEDEDLQLLSHFLFYMPVTLFGWTPEEILEYAPVALLRCFCRFAGFV